MAVEPGEIDLFKSGTESPLGETPRSRRTLAIVAVLAVVGLVIGVDYFFLRRGPWESSTPAARRQAADAVKVKSTDEPIALPPLDQTDALVRQLVGALSSHPVVAAWLTTDGLIVNFVVVTKKIGDGQNPVIELKTLGPVAPFRVTTSRNAPYIDPASYHRYDRYAQAISSLDARGAVRLYETLKPRIADAHRQFGGSNEFDAELERAIVELLKVPVVEGDVALTPQGIGYAFADARLEELSPPQKQLLRMGPDNVLAIQSKLREIASYLAIPESKLPAGNRS